MSTLEQIVQILTVPDFGEDFDAQVAYVFEAADKARELAERGLTTAAPDAKQRRG